MLSKQMLEIFVELCRPVSPIRRLRQLKVFSKNAKKHGVKFALSKPYELSFKWSDYKGIQHPLSRQLVDAKVSSDLNYFRKEIDLYFENESLIWSVAEKCHVQLGVWPISLSYPFSTVETIGPRKSLVSKIIPGDAYSFEDYQKYLDSYRQSYFGITHKKGGWDCFRHLEIMFSGAIPLMADALDIPEFSMVHYPKKELGQVFGEFVREARDPSDNVRQGFQRHFNKFLTTEAMAGYLLRCSGLLASKKILFIDTRLGSSPDHFSFLTLIGLVQLKGCNVSVLSPVPYIWADWNGSEDKLYGRGFGYTRILDSQSRNEISDSYSKVRRQISDGVFDAVVFGSIMRNTKIFSYLQPVLDPKNTLLINGEDLPTPSETIEKLVNTGSHIFIRSLGSDGDNLNK